MARWRAKLVSLLVVYSSGFITAIYLLAPPPERTSELQLPTGATIDREKLIRRVNQGLHDCVALGKDAAGRVVFVLREQINQTSTSSPDGES